MDSALAFGVLFALSAAVYAMAAMQMRRRTLRVVLRLGKAATYTDDSWLRFFELRRSEFPGTLSVAEYFGSLELKRGSFSLQSILGSILEKYGLSLALPFALLIPAKLAFDKDSHAHHFVAPKALAKAMMSSVCLGAICETVKELGQKARFDLMPADVDGDGVQTAVSPRSAVMKMLEGSGDAETVGAMRRFQCGHETLALESVEDIVAAVMTNTNTREPSSCIPKEISPQALPGLRYGNTGLEYLYSPAEERMNEVISTICNKLCGNLLMEDDDHTFHVRFIDQKAPATTLENFFESLETIGHHVVFEIRTNITSMGIGMSVLRDGQDPREALNVPMCFPIKTNMMIPLGTDRRNDVNGIHGSSVCDGFRAHDEVISLMTHAAVFVTITGPIVNASLEWCLNINGMTGFQGCRGVSRPWQTDPCAYVIHSASAFSTQRRRKRAARLMSIISAVTNAQADVDGIVLGGYGYFGVCCDSVALLQAALTNETTIYPLLLGGAAKQSLADAYRAFPTRHRHGHHRSKQYKKDAMHLRTNLLRLPCDIVVSDPTSCAQRCLRSLPSRSIFTCLENTIRQLEWIIHSSTRPSPAGNPA